MNEQPLQRNPLFTLGERVGFLPTAKVILADTNLITGTIIKYHPNRRRGFIYTVFTDQRVYVDDGKEQFYTRLLPIHEQLLHRL